MDRFHRKRGQAYRDVFGAAFVGSRVADPFASVGYDRLAGGYFE
jgi:hypothetical protein